MIHERRQWVRRDSFLCSPLKTENLEGSTRKLVSIKVLITRSTLRIYLLPSTEGVTEVVLFFFFFPPNKIQILHMGS
jgi:hypothetical protein